MSSVAQMLSLHTIIHFLLMTLISFLKSFSILILAFSLKFIYGGSLPTSEFTANSIDNWHFSCSKDFITIDLAPYFEMVLL